MVTALLSILAYTAFLIIFVVILMRHQERVHKADADMFDGLMRATPRHFNSHPDAAGFTQYNREEQPWAKRID